MEPSRFFTSRIVVMALALALSTTCAHASSAPRSASARKTGAPIVHTQSLTTTSPLNVLYGGLGEAWWKWVFSFPFSQWPTYDPSGNICDRHQPPVIWFLAGSNIGPVTRTCSVPSGRSLFFPLANLENDYPCPDTTFHPAAGQSLEDFLTQGARAVTDTYLTDLFCEVDGVALQNLFSNRGTSRMFNFTADPAAAAGFDPCITGTLQQAVSDGYWVLLPPMRRGAHTIHFGSQSFGQDITYHLTVGTRATSDGGGVEVRQARVGTWGSIRNIYR